MLTALVDFVPVQIYLPNASRRPRNSFFKLGARDRARDQRPIPGPLGKPSKKTLKTAFKNRQTTDYTIFGVCEHDGAVCFWLKSKLKALRPVFQLNSHKMDCQLAIAAAAQPLPSEKSLFERKSSILSGEDILKRRKRSLPK